MVQDLKIGGIKIFNRKNMKKLELTKDELEKLYYLPPKDVEKETEFQITYRMGRNSLVLELIKKIDEELTPHIEYYSNGNVWVKGQKNSKGQREGIWEWFHESGNIEWRISYIGGKEDGIEEVFYESGNIHIKTPYKGGKWDGIEEVFYESGNIRIKTPYKGGKEDGIVEEFDERGNIIRTRHWKDGKRIEETKPKPQPDPQLIDSMAMRYRHDFGFLDEKHKESIRTTMKQLWEEVVGLGFYKPKSK
jgi:antitoxin component YwqK of YwqJK toxin-antitoxin module